MFVHYSLRNNVSYQAIAMLVLAAMLAWTVGAQFLGTTAQAANVVEFSDTLTDSRASQASGHSLRFILPSGATDDQTIIIDFDASLVVGAFPTDAATDVGVSVDSTPVTVDGTGTGAVWAASVAGNAVTLTVGSGGVPTDGVVEVFLGTPNGGGNFITNPAGTTTSYTVDITEASTITDYGQTRIAITDNVLVTAQVATNFDFDVIGMNADTVIPGLGAATTSATSSSNSLPFGLLEAGVSKRLAHELNVTTNAINGFVVTVQQTGDLNSATGAIIDSFYDGTYLDVPAAWGAHALSPDISDDKTWGHWGLASDDDDYGGDNLWVAASTTQPRTIFQHSSSSDGTTVDIGSTTIAYQIEITALQEAANDYTTNLIYVATPTF